MSIKSLTFDAEEAKALGYTEDQIKEYKDRIKRIGEIHPTKISRVLALCTSGVCDDDIQQITHIPLELIEVLVGQVIPDKHWLTLTGEVENTKQTTYEVLRTSEVSANVITETTMAKKADTVLDNTLTYLRDKTQGGQGFKSIGEAHQTLRSMASLYPILSKRGRLKEIEDEGDQSNPTNLVQQAVIQYNQNNFSNPTSPIVNKESQVVGVRTQEGTRTVEMMPRSELDRLAESSVEDGVYEPKSLSEKIAKDAAMKRRSDQDLVDAVTNSKTLDHDEMVKILEEASDGDNPQD